MGVVNQDFKKKFGVNLLEEFTDLEGNLTYIEQINSKYEWSSSNKRELSAQIGRIREKQKDRNLNLSVIGEFSTGKSTFINALLRAALLESNITQGTTVAATVIQYAKKKSLTIKRQIEGKEELQKIQDSRIEDEAAFVREITKATTNNSLHCKNQTVVIEYPSETLKNNIVIVDTPGTNVTENWQEEVTSNAIRQLSDASIIMIDAVKPMPMSLISFVNDNLQDVIKNCVFIVNRMDLLREDEREEQLSYIKRNIAKTFDIAEPVVCPYVSLFVLGESVPQVLQQVQHDREKIRPLVAQSYQTESRIYAYLAKRRAIIQATKLCELMSQLFDVLHANMQERMASYEQQHKEIEDAKIKDIEKYLSNKASDVSGSILLTYSNNEKNYETILEKKLLSKKEEIRAQLWRMLDKQVLNLYVNRLPINLHKAAKEVVESGMQDVISSVLAAGNKEWENFFAEFKQHYHRLAVHNNNKKLQVTNLESIFKVRRQAELSTQLADASTKYINVEKVLTWIPVADNIFNFFAGSIEAMKKKYWSQMEQEIDRYFQSVFREIMTSLSHYNQSVMEQMQNSIEGCKAEYNLLIAAIDQQDNLRQNELKAYVLDIKKDLKELSNRKETIQSLRVQLAQL